MKMRKNIYFSGSVLLSGHNTYQQSLDNSETVFKRAEMEKYLKFRCSVCKKILQSKASLDMHMNVHTGAKPFVCARENCGARFNHIANLSRHVKTVHQKQP